MYLAKLAPLALSTSFLLVSLPIFADQALGAGTETNLAISNDPKTMEIEDKAENGTLAMSYVDGLLSVKSNNAPIRSVLQLLARETECTLTLNSEPDANATIDIELSDAPLRTAVAELLKGIPHEATYLTDPETNRDVLQVLEVTPTNGTEASVHEYAVTDETPVPQL